MAALEVIVKTGRYKFRFWDGERFSYWGFVDYHKGLLSFAGIGTSNVRPLSLEEIMQRSEQCTGLVDKNGVEIWEGDIIKIDVEDREYIRAIIHDQGGPSIIIDKYYTPFIGSLYYEGAEILGNIHQNPKLQQLSQR